jgi:hypothetical protein
LATLEAGGKALGILETHYYSRICGAPTAVNEKRNIEKMHK